MAAFLRMKQASERDPIISLFASLNAAEASLARETAAATLIQSVARMHTQHKSFSAVIHAILGIQKVYRGFIARKSTLETLIDREQRRQAAVYHYFATLIQSRFRGFLSRTHGFDYYCQRRNVAAIVKKSDAVREEAQLALERQLVLIEAEHAAADVDEYQRSLASKHHLLSTATIGGVYRPPLTDAGTRTIFGTTLEEDLRTAAKVRKFRPDLPTSTSTAPSSSRGHPHEPTPPAAAASGGATTSSAAGASASPRTNRLWGNGSLDHRPPQSLQSSAPYDLVEQNERYTRSLNKAVASTMHAGKEFAVRKPEGKNAGPTIASQSPYKAPPTMRNATR